MSSSRPLHEDVPIAWYRSPVDKDVMRRLMVRSDARAFRHVLLHLLLFATTATVTYLAFRQINGANWIWTVPLTLFCLFWHGTFAGFLGGVANHELCHKTPFRTARWNDIFLGVFSFLSWYDFVGFRLSHVKHHQVTVHHGRDGEVILPLNLEWRPLREGEVALPERFDRSFIIFLLRQFQPVPSLTVMWQRLKMWTRYATGRLDGLGMYSGGEWWTETILPADKPEARRKHQRWGQTVLFGHLLLALIFAATGNWFLILLINCNGTYAGWLGNLCGLPQHLGMGPDVPDFRLCCRTYTCNRFIGFLYWNMQYHVEHHMFPAVPFYNLPELRKAIASDLPPAPHGLWATWKEIVAILARQRREPGYCFVPVVGSP